MQLELVKPGSGIQETEGPRRRQPIELRELIVTRLRWRELGGSGLRLRLRRRRREHDISRPRLTMLGCNREREVGRAPDIDEWRSVGPDWDGGSSAAPG